jgi:phospholipid/cholesterol/gamma-HCH transport system substrate-binding protein
VKTAIRKHLGDFLAILFLFVMAVGIGGFILSKQRLRFPLIQKPFYEVKAVLPNSQAVTPGQGQTVRVAGVEVGQIGKIKLQDGRAVVNLEIEPKYKSLIKRDASALLRAKTGVKDMFIEVDPGESKQVMPKDGQIPVSNTEQDIDPDEILSALDSDTRDYLKLLVSGAGKGLSGRGGDLQEALARLGPLHKDLARVTRAIATRRANLRRLIHNYGLLTEELGNNSRSLTSLVSSSSEVFKALASVNPQISTAVARLPGTLRQTQSTLAKVDPYSKQLQTTLQALRPAFRQLDTTNKQVIPAVKEGTPILKHQVRPFARAANPFTSNLGQSAKNLAGAAPQLTATFHELNRLFNLGAYNPGGRQGLTGNLAQDRQRDEGYLYWLAWTAQNTVSMFSTSDANGPFRRIYLGGLSCASIRAFLPPTATLPPPVTDPVALLGKAGVCAGP